MIRLLQLWLSDDNVTYSLQLDDDKAVAVNIWMIHCGCYSSTEQDMIRTCTIAVDRKQWRSAAEGLNRAARCTVEMGDTKFCSRRGPTLLTALMFCWSCAAGCSTVQSVFHSFIVISCLAPNCCCALFLTSGGSSVGVVAGLWASRCGGRFPALGPSQCLWDKATGMCR